MRLNVFALSAAAALLWGGALLLVACAHLAWPPYGAAFLEVVASIYPGYDASGGIASVFVVTLWGVADGAIGGAVFASLYNLFCGRKAA